MTEYELVKDVVDMQHRLSRVEQILNSIIERDDKPNDEPKR